MHGPGQKNIFFLFNVFRNLVSAMSGFHIVHHFLSAVPYFVLSFRLLLSLHDPARPGEEETGN